MPNSAAEDCPPSKGKILSCRKRWSEHLLPLSSPGGSYLRAPAPQDAKPYRVFKVRAVASGRSSKTQVLPSRQRRRSAGRSRRNSDFNERQFASDVHIAVSDL